VRSENSAVHVSHDGAAHVHGMQQQSTLCDAYAGMRHVTCNDAHVVHAGNL
jgi:hypothetical protein